MIKKIFKSLKIFIFIFLIYPHNLISDENFIDKLSVPEGFEIEIFAEDLDSPRQITQTLDGHIVIGSKKGNEVVAILKNSNDEYIDKVIIASELQNPTGVSFFNGDLYFAEIDTIWKIEDIDEWLKSGSKSLPKKQFI